MNRLIVKDTTIITMDDQARILKGDILIKDSRIIKVGRTYRSDGATVIDGSGKVAIPGLVNAHTHAAMTLLRGYADDLALMEWLETKIWPREAHLKPADVYRGTMLAIAEMIRGGTTCFADMYFYPDEVAKAVVETGIRASLCGVLLGILPEAGKMVEEAARFVRRWHGAEGRITAMFGPHALYTCPIDMLKEVAAHARESGVGVHIHLLETLGERENILATSGEEPFTVLKETGLFELPLLAAHAVYLTSDEIGLAAHKVITDAPFTPVHNPGSNLKLASGIAPVPAYLKAGIPVALGTDGAASNNNLDMFEEIRLAALIHKVNTLDPTVVSAYEALTLATRGGATAVGLETEIGQIKEGMRADIALIGMERPHFTPLHDVVTHIVYSASAADVTDTIVGGAVLMRNGELTSVDEEKVMREASAAADDLMRRT